MTHITLAERDSIHRHLVDAVEVNEGGDDDENVENLM
jgi:hypothetical protein